jgi:hypothetical protein
MLLTAMKYGIAMQLPLIPEQGDKQMCSEVRAVMGQPLYEPYPEESLTPPPGERNMCEIP